MRRLSTEEKEKIVRLSKRGFSLRQISSELNTGKTTIYYHTRKFFGKKLKPFQFVNNKEKIGEFIGIFAGDGSYYEYGYVTRFFFSADEKRYAENVQKILSKMFNRRANLFLDKNTGIYVIRFNSKDIGNFVKRYLIWNNRRPHQEKNEIRLFKFKETLKYQEDKIDNSKDLEHLHKNVDKLVEKYHLD